MGVGSSKYHKFEPTDRLTAMWYAMQQTNTPMDERIPVYYDWREINNFRLWARMQGYNDTMHIKRLNLRRGYEPKNCILVSTMDTEENVLEATGALLAALSKVKGLSTVRFLNSITRLVEGSNAESLMEVTVK